MADCHTDDDGTEEQDGLPNDIAIAFLRVTNQVDEGLNGQLEMHEPFTGPGEPDRYRLRVRHPDTCVSDVSPRLTAEGIEGYLTGLADGLDGKIDRKDGQHDGGDE